MWAASVSDDEDIQNSSMRKENENNSNKNAVSSDSEESDALNSHANSPQSEKKLESITRRKQNDKNAEKSSSFNNKVNVLQNVCLTPSKHKPLKERLQSIFPGIKEIKNDMTLEFSDAEDVYLFRVPKNVEPASLQSIEINLDQKCKINIGKKYNVGPTQNIPPPTLAVSENCKILNFTGNIEMEKRIKKKKDPNIEIPETKLVPLPNNLKKRHPLFGSDYKEKIQLSEHVKQKVDHAIEILMKKGGKPKKNKHKQIKLDTEEHKNGAIFTLLNNHGVQSDKNVKKELLENDTESLCSAEKLNKTSNFTYSINQTLKRIKSEIHTETESDNQEYISPKKKRKNKQLNNSMEQTPTNKIHAKIKTEPSDLSNYDNKLNSTLIPDISNTPSFSPEVSKISFDQSNVEKTPKKPKKKKTGSDEQKSQVEEQLISNILDKLKSDLSPKKVKKKKMRSE